MDSRHTLLNAVPSISSILVPLMTPPSTSQDNTNSRESSPSVSADQPPGSAARAPRKVQWAVDVHHNASTHALDERGLDVSWCLCLCHSPNELMHPVAGRV
jgi:hypothetical protein